jgi:hypothetical protein
MISPHRECFLDFFRPSRPITELEHRHPYCSNIVTTQASNKAMQNKRGISCFTPRTVAASTMHNSVSPTADGNWGSKKKPVPTGPPSPPAAASVYRRRLPSPLSAVGTFPPLRPRSDPQPPLRPRTDPRPRHLSKPEPASKSTSSPRAHPTPVGSPTAISAAGGSRRATPNLLRLLRR